MVALYKNIQSRGHHLLVHFKEKVPGFQNWMLEDDVRDEERNPDYSFIIPAKVALDEGSSIFNNCCNAVKRTFEAGGAEVPRS